MKTKMTHYKWQLQDQHIILFHLLQVGVEKIATEETGLTKKFGLPQKPKFGPKFLVSIYIFFAVEGCIIYIIYFMIDDR